MFRAQNYYQQSIFIVIVKLALWRNVQYWVRPFSVYLFQFIIYRYKYYPYKIATDNIYWYIGWLVVFFIKLS